MIIDKLKALCGITFNRNKAGDNDNPAGSDYINNLAISSVLSGLLPAENLQKLQSLISSQQNNLEDDYVRYQISECLAAGIYPEYKYSEFGRIFLEDKKFIEYYRQFMDQDNWHSLDRKYTLNELLKLVVDLSGDYVECGVYRGASAWLMCQAAGNTASQVHLFDSFKGLSSPGQKDGEYWVEGALQSSAADVKEGLKQFNNFKIYKGWIPEVFGDYKDAEVCFLHVDVDLYEPTYYTLEYFYPKMTNHGVILMDDYGFASCPGAKLAADEFFADRPESILSLPTGQGLVIKK